MTAKAVRQQLPAKADSAHVPAERTVLDIMNRLGYQMRRVRKTPPPKKVPETEAIFENLRQVHAQAAQDPETLRISFDTKAKVKIGAFSRGGVARGKEPVRASDHDMHPEAILTPAGILEVDAGQLNLIFGTSRDTSAVGLRYTIRTTTP